MIVLVVGGDMPWIVPAVLLLLVDALVADTTLGAATLEADPPTALPMAVRPWLARSAGCSGESRRSSCRPPRGARSTTMVARFATSTPPTTCLAVDGWL